MSRAIPRRIRAHPQPLMRVISASLLLKLGELAIKKEPHIVNSAMARARLDMAQEGQLWEMALEHLGSDGLLQAVIEMWSRASTQTIG